MLEGVFRGSEAVAAELVTKNKLRGPGYRRLFPDIYVRDGDPSTEFATICRAAGLLVAPRGGVVAGYSAAALLGADCTPRNAPVEVVAAVDVRARPGLLVRRGVVSGPDRWRVGDCAVTSPERSAWDLVRHLDLVEGVVALDALARLRFPEQVPFTPKDLLRRRRANPGARGCRKVQRAVALADPRAESPMETRLRLLLVLAGLPAPTVQHAVIDRWGSVVAQVRPRLPRRAAGRRVRRQGPRSARVHPRRPLPGRGHRRPRVAHDAVRVPGRDGHTGADRRPRRPHAAAALVESDRRVVRRAVGHSPVELGDRLAEG